MGAEGVLVVEAGVDIDELARVLHGERIAQQIAALVEHLRELAAVSAVVLVWSAPLELDDTRPGNELGHVVVARHALQRGQIEHVIPEAKGLPSSRVGEKELATGREGEHRV